MNFSKTLIFIFISFVSLSACHEKSLPKDPLEYFPDKFVMIVGSIVQTNGELLSGGTIKLFKDSILAIKNMKENNLLTLVNTHNGEVLKKMIPRGKGPGEMTILKFCENTYDSLWIYDANQQTLFEVNFNKLFTQKDYKIEKKINFHEYEPSVFFSIGNRYVGAINALNKRFSLYDHHGNYLSSCLQYLKSPQYESFPDRVYATGFQGTYTIHPDNKRFAFATLTSGNINIFTLKNDSIVMTKNLCFYEPSMKRDEWVCVNDKNNLQFAFCEIASNSQYIIILYSGRKAKDHPTDSYVCEYLLKFDWEGNPVKKYKLDKPLISMCMNKAGTQIYGIAEIPEPTIVQYDLPQ